MRKFILAFIATLILAVPTFAQSEPVVTSNLDAVINDLTGGDGVIEIAVGETKTISVTVETDTPWLSAALVPDSFFPGRGVFFQKRDTAGSGNETTLTIEFTGKSGNNNRGDLPQTVVLAVRYQGGYVVVESADFTIIVVE